MTEDEQLAPAERPPSRARRRRRTDGPEKPPLNPAHAVLMAAVLSAVAGLSATFLNIRSSERLSSEREKSAAAAAQQAELRTQWDAKVADLKQQLDVANRRIETLIANTVPGTPVTAAPLPSIVVVLPQPTTGVPRAVRPVPEPTTVVPTTTSTTTTTMPVPATTTTMPSPSTTTTMPGTHHSE